MKTLEHDIQVAFFRELAWREAQDERLQLVCAIPNAGKRSIGAANYYKAEGLRAGMPDVLIPVPARGYGALWIEFKAPGKKMTAAQKDKAHLLQKYGHRVLCLDNAQEAIEWTDWYLKGDSKSE